MLRVKDAQKSLDFYTKTMGMTLKRTSENPDNKFNLYFLSYDATPTKQTANNVNPIADHEGILELTWNYGTENQEGKVYHNGNDEPQGFGHIAVVVDDVEKACQRFEECGVSWKKRLTDGRMKEIAFIYGECSELPFRWLVIRDLITAYRVFF